MNDVFALNGYALEEEANLDLHADSFAWDGEVYEVRSEQASAKLPVLFNLKFKELPKQKNLEKLKRLIDKNLEKFLIN